MITNDPNIWKQQPGEIVPTTPPVSKPGAPIIQTGAGLPGAISNIPQKNHVGRPTRAEQAERARLGLSRPPGTAAGADSKPARIILEPLWTPENSGPIAELFFLIPAISTKWPGWELTPAESERIARPLAQVLNAFVPQGGKYAAITALSTTLLVIGGMKVKDYKAFIAKNTPKTETEPGK